MSPHTTAPALALLGLVAACDGSDKSTVQEPPPSLAEEDERSQPADQCAASLPDFTDASVPTVFSGDLPANGADLAVFAWQHFVALSWQSSSRGQPDTAKTFFDVPTLPVWSSYLHRNEQFPASGEPPASYNTAPAYNYKNVSGPCDSATDTNPNAYVNLDEASQLGLDYMFAAPGTDTFQVLYEAKVNEANYNYIMANALYTSNAQKQRSGVNTNNLNRYGGICQDTQPTYCSQEPVAEAGYCLPCDSDESEGTIHVKAAWRQLTAEEASSGRFFTSPVVLYKVDPEDSSKVCYSNAAGETWGLIGLHIIHKTRQFPAFVFASWEQVDNATSNLTFENTTSGGPSGTVGKRLPWARATHGAGKVSLPSSGVEAVNTCVQQAIAAGSQGSSPWQHYQLVGVQGTPVDLAESSTDLPDYYLANNVIESNDFFQSFLGTNGSYSSTGTGPAGTTPGDNVHTFNTATGTSDVVDMGGCQGCHGNAQRTGTDMSFLGAGFSSTADAINEFENVSPNNARFQTL